MLCGDHSTTQSGIRISRTEGAKRVADKQMPGSDPLPPSRSQSRAVTKPLFLTSCLYNESNIRMLQTPRTHAMEQPAPGQQAASVLFAQCRSGCTSGRQGSQC